MPKHRILIVEDERDIAGLIKHTLERNTDTEAHIVWSGDAALKAMTERPPTRSVDVHVGRLRSKLRAAGRQIETVVGLGYRFVDGQTAQP